MRRVFEALLRVTRGTAKLISKLGYWLLVIFGSILALCLLTEVFYKGMPKILGPKYSWPVAKYLLAGTGIGLLITIISNKFKSEPNRPMTSRERVRGRTLISFDRVKELAKNFSGPFWGFVNLPKESATQHFAVIGSTGSGKTMLLRMLMQSVLPAIRNGSNSRALIYDAKADIIPIIYGIGVNCPVWILNPFDERSSAWEMGADVTAPATAQQIATILIAPGKNESQPFFTDAARALLTGVMVSFLKRSPGKWGLSDVIHATRSAGILREVLNATEETKYLVGQYLEEGHTSQNILSSLATKLQPFEFIAAAWDRAKSSISLREWLSSESILILGNDEATRSALDAINRVIFRRVTELVLAESESTTRRTWFILDEIRQAGLLDGLNNLLTVGRSKGACVVVGAQDLEGLRDVYGENKANELLGLCGHKAILRLDSPITAKWASELFGTVEELETRTSQSNSTTTMPQQGSSTSGTQVSEQHIVRDVVLPSELLSMPFPNPQRGMIGYFLSPEFGGAGYRVHMSGDWILGDLKKPSDEPALLPRAEDHQFLNAWSETRRSELGLGKRVASAPQQQDKSTNLDNVLDEVLAESKERKKESLN